MVVEALDVSVRSCGMDFPFLLFLFCVCVCVGREGGVSGLD